MLLIAATGAAAGYFVADRGSAARGVPRDFVHTAERVATTARSLPSAAQDVQRFTELHSFDVKAGLIIAGLTLDVHRLHQIAARASGSAKLIATQAAAAGDQAIDAAQRYREAVVFTYQLANADAAHQDLDAAAATLDQQAKAWSRA